MKRISVKSPKMLPAMQEMTTLSQVPDFFWTITEIY